MASNLSTFLSHSDVRECLIRNSIVLGECSSTNDRNLVLSFNLVPEVFMSLSRSDLEESLRKSNHYLLVYNDGVAGFHDLAEADELWLPSIEYRVLRELNEIKRRLFSLGVIGKVRLSVRVCLPFEISLLPMSG